MLDTQDDAPKVVRLGHFVALENWRPRTLVVLIHEQQSNREQHDQGMVFPGRPSRKLRQRPESVRKRKVPFVEGLHQRPLCDGLRWVLESAPRIVYVAAL